MEKFQFAIGFSLLFIHFVDVRCSDDRNQPIVEALSTGKPENLDDVLKEIGENSKEEYTKTSTAVVEMFSPRGILFLHTMTIDKEITCYAYTQTGSIVSATFDFKVYNPQGGKTIRMTRITPHLVSWKALPNPKVAGEENLEVGIYLKERVEEGDNFVYCE